MNALNEYTRLGDTLANAPDLPEGVRAARVLGLERLRERGFPAAGDEAWKYTNANRLLGSVYVPRDPAGIDALPASALAHGGGPRVVLVDGVFHEALSTVASAPSGLRFAVGPVDGLGEVLGDDIRGFTALNLMFGHDAVVIEVDAGVALTEPLHVVHVSTGDERLHAVRLRIALGRSASATVVEHWIGAGSGASLTTAVTEIALDDNASLHHVRVQDEAPEALHVGTVVARQGRDARWHSHAVSLGAAIQRVTLRSVLEGEGPEVHLSGLYLGCDRQHTDHHTVVDHRVPHTTSREHYKGIVDDRARGVFTGRVVVHPDAQKIDSAQSNDNLLLSSDAIANTRPQLEIYADDVKCAHGATIGRIDPEASFYLRSRGLSEVEARSLLTLAFANEVLSRVPDEGVRDRLVARVSGWLGDR